MARGLYERVDAAMQRGEVWRAKELLRGNIGSGSYDSPLYERYGRLLLDLGELVEAGKYLFLSGRRRPEFDEAIKVYLSRHPEDRPEVLYYSFPSAVRFRQIPRYPLAVRRVLEERGLPQYFARLEQERIERAKRQRAKRESERMGDQTHRALHRWEYMPLGTWAPYEPGLRHTPAQWACRMLLQGFLSAVILFLLVFLLVLTVVGVVVTVRWVASLI